MNFSGSRLDDCSKQDRYGTSELVDVGGIADGLTRVFGSTLDPVSSQVKINSRCRNWLRWRFLGSKVVSGSGISELSLGKPANSMGESSER